MKHELAITLKELEKVVEKMKTNERTAGTLSITTCTSLKTITVWKLK